MNHLIQCKLRNGEKEKASLIFVSGGFKQMFITTNASVTICKSNFTIFTSHTYNLNDIKNIFSSLDIKTLTKLFVIVYLKSFSIRLFHFNM